MMHLCFAGGLRVSELVGVLTENVSLGRDAERDGPRQGPQGTLPAALEGDRARPAGLAERAGAGSRAGAVRQRRGRSR